MLSGLDISADPLSIASMIDLLTIKFIYLSAEVLRNFSIVLERAFDEELCREKA
jgi:hypothetical protein